MSIHSQYRKKKIKQVAESFLVEFVKDDCQEYCDAILLYCVIVTLQHINVIYYTYKVISFRFVPQVNKKIANRPVVLFYCD